LIYFSSAPQPTIVPDCSVLGIC